MVLWIYYGEQVGWWSCYCNDQSAGDKQQLNGEPNNEWRAGSHPTVFTSPECLPWLPWIWTIHKDSLRKTRWNSRILAAETTFSAGQTIQAAHLSIRTPHQQWLWAQRFSEAQFRYGIRLWRLAKSTKDNQQQKWGDMRTMILVDTYDLQLMHDESWW